MKKSVLGWKRPQFGLERSQNSVFGARSGAKASTEVVFQQGGKLRRSAPYNELAYPYHLSYLRKTETMTFALFVVGSVALYAVINDTAGDDTLDGTSKMDSIFGYGGNDTFTSHGSHDEL